MEGITAHTQSKSHNRQAPWVLKNNSLSNIIYEKQNSTTIILLTGSNTATLATQMHLKFFLIIQANKH